MTKGYEISTTGGDGWEEISVEDFINREKLTNEEIKTFKNTHFATNMHIMISQETLGNVWETLTDIVMKEPKLAGLNAIVFLSLKKKGRGVGHNPISQEEFTRITEFCIENKISFGFDSCSAPKFLKAVEGHKDEEHFKMVAEPCESTRFSVYIDVNGEMYPCSFCEGIEGWGRGISVSKCQDFVKDVWMDEKTVDFRSKCISCMNMKKACQVYEV